MGIHSFFFFGLLHLPSLQHHRMSRGPGVATVYIGKNEASPLILGKDRGAAEGEHVG